MKLLKNPKNWQTTYLKRNANQIKSVTCLMLFSTKQA